ncbi:hypothetical protein D3C86_1560250 [compost metagenome]
MNVVTVQQRALFQPAVIVVLRIRQTQVCLTHFQAKTQHHVVSAEISAGEVIVIEVLPYPVKLACRHRQTQPQLRQSETFESIF